MRNSMQLGESINTYDPTEALREELGTFRVTVPAGAELVLTCKPGETLVKWGDPHNRQQPFLISKISEPAHVGTATPITKIA